MACTKMHTNYILFSPATVNKLGAISIVLGFFAKHLFISQNHNAEASFIITATSGKVFLFCKDANCCLQIDLVQQQNESGETIERI